MRILDMAFISSMTAGVTCFLYYMLAHLKRYRIRTKVENNKRILFKQLMEKDMRKKKYYLLRENKDYLLFKCFSKHILDCKYIIVFYEDNCVLGDTCMYYETRKQLEDIRDRNYEIASIYAKGKRIKHETLQDYRIMGKVHNQILGAKYCGELGMKYILVEDELNGLKSYKICGSDYSKARNDFALSIMKTELASGKTNLDISVTFLQIVHSSLKENAA